MKLSVSLHKKKDDETAGCDQTQRKSARTSISDQLNRRYHDDKVVGLSSGVRQAMIVSGSDHKLPMMQSDHDSFGASLKVRYEQYNGDIPLEDDEAYARMKEERRPFVLFLLGYWTACKIFVYYLVSLSSILTLALSIGLTIYWYGVFQSDPNESLSASGMDWVLLGFAVVTPLSLTIGIAFRRRERALIEIAKFRSFAFQLLLAHCIWDWDVPPKEKGRAGTTVDWVGHADDVLTELIAIGDELCRFLTLPTASRSRHRVTKSGRHEAARTQEVAYRLYDSLYTKRMIRLAVLAENFKRAGLPSGEASRIRQYERFMGEAIENLRMIKNYRTPQTLRSFARLFTTLLPPFFAPTYAQIAVNIDNLPMGITFAIVTSLCLNALLEGMEILEDPFVAFVTLDGIDVREEFQVLHWHQLVNARDDIFSEVAEPYAGPRRNAFFVSRDLSNHDETATSLPQRPTQKSEVPLENVSEATKGSHSRQRPPRSPTHRSKMLSFGDNTLLAGLEAGVDPSSLPRKSGYQFFKELPFADDNPPIGRKSRKSLLSEEGMKENQQYESEK